MPPLPRFWGLSAHDIMPTTHNVTELLAWATGDEHALNDPTPIVYKELRQLPAAYLERAARPHAAADGASSRGVLANPEIPARLETIINKALEIARRGIKPHPNLSNGRSSGD